MASRLDVQARREALYQSLKQSCLDGSLPPGVMLPTVRELGERHGVSANVVFGVVRAMTDEGLLFTVPRVGTFVGRPQRDTLELYLMIVPRHETNREDYWVQAKSGFEDRISQLGARSLVLTADEAHAQLERGSLPPLAGVFGKDIVTAEQLLPEGREPRVFFGNPGEGAGRVDLICFDDAGGGAQAARHLWQAGHRAIAFLALHAVGEAGDFSWSARREDGWRGTLEQAGGSGAGLAFHPAHTAKRGWTDQVASGREAATGLAALLAASAMAEAAGPGPVTAVIAANFAATQGMFEAFRAVNLPAEAWPAVVCFDGAAAATSSGISYLRLPWEEVGRAAAQILWERHSGRLAPAKEVRLVPMRLIPRLSCRPDWAANEGLISA